MANVGTSELQLTYRDLEPLPHLLPPFLIIIITMFLS